MSKLDDIEVVQVSSTVKPLTVGERTELFVTLSKTLGEPVWFFESLGLLLDKATRDETFMEIPDVLMLTIRKLCTFPCCIPIVGTRRVVPDIQKILGGARESDKKSPKKDNPFSVLTYFVGPQNFLYSDLSESRMYEVAFQESLDVIGIKLIDSNTIKSVNWEIFAKVPGPVSLIKSGLYSVEFLNTVLFKPYEAISHKLFELMPGGQIMFSDESSTNELCKETLNVLFQLYRDINSASSEWTLHNKLDLIRSNNELDTLSKALRKQIVPHKTGPVKAITQNRSNSMEKYLTVISNILPTYNTKFDSSVWFDLTSIGRPELLSRIYLRSLDYEDKDLPKYLEQLSEQQAKYIKSTAEDSARLEVLWKRRYREMRFRWFYIQKFEFFKFEEMMSLIPKTLIDTAEMRNYITPKETKVIDIELDRAERFEQTLQTNKEEWVGLVRRMRYETSRPAKLELYKKLRKFILPADLARSPRSTKDTKALKEADYLRSKSDYPIICPHVRDTMELMDSNADELRDYLASNYATEETLLDDAYYCRICGEVLFSLDQVGLTNSIRAEGYGHNEDELKKYIWKQVNWLLRAEIDFKELRSDLDVKSVIRDIVGRIHPFIDQIERKLLKSKTMSNYEFENYKRILTIVYIYAIFIRIILDNPKELKFKAFDFKKPNVDKMIKYATDKIIDTQNIIINAMQNITSEYIGSMLVKAYDGISDYIGKTKMQAPDPMSLIDYIVADPLYWFLVKQWWASSIDKIPLQKLELKLAQLAMPENILGQTLSKIEADGDAIFAKSPNPLKGAPEWNKAALVDASKSPMDLLNMAYHARMGSVANWLLDYTKSGVYLSPIWNVKIEPSPTGDVIEVKKNPDYIKFESSHDTRDLDRTIDHLWQTYTCPPYSNLYKIKTTRLYPGFTDDGYKYIAYYHGTEDQDTANKKLMQSEPTKSGLHKHNWKNYAYVKINEYKPNAKLSSYKNAIIVKKGDPIPDLNKYRMLDQYCSICFKSWSEVPNDIRADIEREQTIGSFYNYYIKICPEQSNKANTLHDFGKSSYDADVKCKLCGFSKTIYESKDDKFFKKYLQVFKRDTKTIEAFDVQPSFKLHEPQTAVDKFTYNNNIMNEFIQITFDLFRSGTAADAIQSITITKQEYTNIISNLGLITGYDYDQIKKGTKTPSKNLTPTSALIRRNIIHPYVQTILIELSKIVNPIFKDPTLNKILDQINKAEVTKLDPTIIQKEMGNYYEISQYLNTLDPIKQAEYTYEYLLKLILKIHQIMDKSKSKYKNDITIYLINLIIAADESTSRVKPQRAAAIEATNQTNKDPNIVDNDQSRMFDTLVDPDASDKYGFEEMDYEGDGEEFESSKDF
jgi:hypothetical protein